MVRKNSTTALAVLSQEEAAIEANKFIPRAAFQELPFWGKLNKREQDIVFSEGNQLNAVMIINASSTLAIGEHIKHLHKVLEPYPKAFAKMLRRFNFSERSGYRYMNGYEEVRERFNFQDHLLRAAMARGMNLPGKYEEALVKYPPPRALPQGEENRYLDQLVQTRKEITKARAEGTISKAPITDEIKKDPRVLLMQSYRMAKNAMRHLTARQRRRFVEALVGMLLTEQGIGSQTSFEPEAIPEEFRQGRGRPAKQEEEDE